MHKTTFQSPGPLRSYGPPAKSRTPRKNLHCHDLALENNHTSHYFVVNIEFGLSRGRHMNTEARLSKREVIRDKAMKRVP